MDPRRVITIHVYLSNPSKLEYACEQRAPCDDERWASIKMVKANLHCALREASQLTAILCSRVLDFYMTRKCGKIQREKYPQGKINIKVRC
jgi:hypothetical protein